MMERRLAISAMTAGALLASLVGCGTLDDFASFASGGAAMRIDVEVYKGPLSQEPAVQHRDLYASLRALAFAVDPFADLIFGQYRDDEGKSYGKRFFEESECLPLSVLLRDTYSSATDHVYLWSRSDEPPLLSDVLRDPFRAAGSEDQRDRIRVIERIFSDLHWSRINTVFASGRGDVSMALIKDDIGNWDLKSFSQDPSDLVDAYTNFGTSIVSAAVDIASSGATAIARQVAEDAEAAVSSAARFRKMTDDLNAAASSPMSGGDSSFLKGARASALIELRRLRESLKAAPAAPGAECKEQPSDEAPEIAKTCAQVVAILDRYRSVLDALQEAAVAGTEADGP